MIDDPVPSSDSSVPYRVYPIQAKTVLRRRKYLDSWFVSRAGMNLYRGCSHDCPYCDGRSERYRVEGDFGRDVAYKVNAPDILTRELDPRRKRKPFRPGFITIGGGVADSWQPAEGELAITRKVLELFRVFPHPLFLLTKSTLILRDFDILEQLRGDVRIVVAVSLSSTDPDLSERLEPGAPSPADRLQVISRAKEAGLAAGVFLLPIVPMITDSPEILDRSYADIREAGADFVLAGSMTLKEGRQWDGFLEKIEADFPDAAPHYPMVYGSVPTRWGNPTPEYRDYLGPLLHETALRHRLPRRVPAALFPDNLTLTERVSVMLDQMDGLLTERGLSSTYGRAARKIAALNEPLEAMGDRRRSIPGVGPRTSAMIREIMDTGTARSYEKILYGGDPPDRYGR